MKDDKHCWIVSTPELMQVTTALKPNLHLGLPFKQQRRERRLVRLAGVARSVSSMSFPGVKTSRDGFLIDTDLDRLKVRIADYFDADLSHEEIARRYPGVDEIHCAIQRPFGTR